MMRGEPGERCADGVEVAVGRLESDEDQASGVHCLPGWLTTLGLGPYALHARRAVASGAGRACPKP